MRIQHMQKNHQDSFARFKAFGSALLVCVIAGAVPITVCAQETVIEEVVITGIRGSLANSVAAKRNSDNLIEAIYSEDIGKLPDQNLAEVLENITGIQITRRAGVGTGVQIRGTNANRTEINGVSTVGSGSGRTGISFEDVSAAMISAVEVTKAPNAKTIEGSVGGTINLKTIRPFDLKDRLANVRLQGEDSSLSSEGGVTPRLSGTYGDNWETDNGNFGVVISASYSEQESTSFRPRLDRDGSLVENFNVNMSDGAEEDAIDRPAAQAFDFLGIQFLNQELENFEYETTNIATTFEFAPNDNFTFYFDAVLNDQERRQDSTRVQASGVAGDVILNSNLPTGFETVNFGSLDGVNLGSIQAAVTGTIQPNFVGTPNVSGDLNDPNLRFNSDTGARITDSQIFRLGTDWVQGDRWSGRVELSSSSSDTVTPTLSTQLNFINPNPLVAGWGSANDNAVPFIYDLRGGRLSFGVDFASPFAPTVAQLTDPNNVVLDQVDVSRDITKNSEDAFRADFTYDLDWNAVTSIDFGYRHSNSSSTFADIGDRIGGFSQMVDSPNGSLFAELLVPGPSNFSSADGRSLAFSNFIIVDPNRAFNDQAGTLAILENAIVAHGGNQDFADLSPNLTAAFDIEEKTNALYAQANFEQGIFRGNVGLRYLETSIASTGNTITNGVVDQVVSKGKYNFLLPRFNFAADISEDLLLRFGWGQDIRRPDFDVLNTSVSFVPNENQSLDIGNPSLEPEEVTSFDISTEWYFAPAAVVSVGYFKKDRTNLISSATDFASVVNNNRETNPACPGGGIFNPIAMTNSFGPVGVTGICVDADTSVNDQATTTQTGIELAVQYDLSDLEDKLGWASGFGVLANYTKQKFEGGSTTNSSATRGTDIFNAINGVYDPNNFVAVTALQGLLDFSENAYNVTVFYEKYGVSARARYTWREAYRTLDTAAGASLNSTLGFPVVSGDRGQLNGSISYDVNDQLNIGLEAVNILEEGVEQHCVNEGALLCAQGIPDRRIVFGASYAF